MSGEIGLDPETCVGPNLEAGAVGVVGGPFAWLLAFVDLAVLPLVRTDDVDEDILLFAAGGSGMVRSSECVTRMYCHFYQWVKYGLGQTRKRPSQWYISLTWPTQRHEPKTRASTVEGCRAQWRKSGRWSHGSQQRMSMCSYRFSSPHKLDTVMDSMGRPNHLLGRLTAGRAYTDGRPGGSHLHKSKRGRCGLR